MGTPFRSASISVFDSTIAHFKLSVKAKFADQGKRPASYVNAKYGIANLNSDIYLVISYKGETKEKSKDIYTSYPQLRKLRRALEKVSDYIDNDGFKTAKDASGNETVIPNPAIEPVVISGIGKSKQSISFRLAVFDVAPDPSIPNAVPEVIKGVAVTVADAEMPCMLSIDDFDTVYTIVNDLRLTDIQVMMSIFYLQENPQEGYAQDSGYAQSPYQQPQGYQQPVYQPQPTYQPAPQQYQHPMSAPTNPAYGHGGYSPRNYGAPARSAGTAAPAAQPKLAPRPEAPAPAAPAAEAPVYKVSYDDESQLGQIFNDSGDSKDDGN